MNVRVEISFTNDFGDKAIGVSEIIESHTEDISPMYPGELDNIIYWVKKALIACGFGEQQVNNALKNSEDI